MQERILVEAFKSSGISSVVVLDDAFDAPKVPDDSMGDLLDVLTSISEDSDFAPDLDRSIAEAAIERLNMSEYDSEEVERAVAILYQGYVRTRDERLDPGDVFRVKKLSSLGYLEPLLRLLRKAFPDEAVLIRGSEGEKSDENARDAQLFFVDYYLDANLAPDGHPSAEQHSTSRNATLERLRGLIHRENADDTEMPVIVLMSSHPVNDAEAFRAEIAPEKGSIFASRFGFLHKKDLSTDGGVLEFKDVAFESLLSVVESFSFGQALYAALEQWRVGVKEAVEEVWGQIGGLGIRDFAYMGRLRLEQEGEKLSHYLEWLFGECLADAMGRNVEWRHEAFGEIDQADGAIRRISGAFDGASDVLARMYHRARVFNPKPGNEDVRRMGDLFLEYDGTQAAGVLALLTPDCDLIIRGDGRRAAKRVLAVRGEIVALDKEEASLMDFFLWEEEPFGIRWKLKDIQTLEHDELRDAALGEKGTLKFVGTLRPAYASELNARVVADVGRVGVSVPPPLWSRAHATARIKTRNNMTEIPVVKPGGSGCSVVFSRGGKDAGRAIFSKSAAVRFLEGLRGIDGNSLEFPDWEPDLSGFVNDAGRQDSLLAKLCQEGMSFGESISGMEVVRKAKWRKGDQRTWCKIVVSVETPEDPG